MSVIVPVVEGDGEVEAVPLLLRRVLREQCIRHDVDVATPKNAHGRGTLLRDLERFLKYAAMTPGCTAVLLLLDADDDCSKELALELSNRCGEFHLDIPIAIVCATRKYEAWFLASLDTIRGKPIKGKPGLSATTRFTGSVEELRGVKEWLTQHMPPGRAYKETLDQAPMTEHIDLESAYARSRSFRRLCHAVEELLQAIDGGSVVITPRSA